MENELPVDLYTLQKVLHLFAFVGWFAGVFHIVRLFVAHRVSLAKWEPDRSILGQSFLGMERRALYFLIWPAMLVVLALGAWMMWTRPGLVRQPFIHVLMGFAALMLVYHMMVHRQFSRFVSGEEGMSTMKLRLFAQGPTVLLFILVMLLMVRQQMNWMAGSLGLVVIGAIVAYGVTSTRSTEPMKKDA